MDEQRPVTSGSAHAWERWYWLWDVYFTVGFATTLGLMLAESTPVGPKLIGVFALGGIAIAYLVTGRRITRDRNGNSAAKIFGVTIVGLFGVAAMTSSSAGFILFALSPILFMSLPVGMAAALAAVAVLLPPLSVVVHNGFTDPSLTTLLPMTIFIIIVGVFIGWWISRIIDQSRERAELIEQLEASHAEVIRLSHETGTAVERERLAREIHDTLAQGFASIVTLAQAIESELDRDLVAARRHLDLAARTARENLAEARTMVAASTPSALAAGSLEDAVRRQADRLAEESEITVCCEIDGPLPALGTATEVVLLRAAQEALTNIRKHADASAVAVRLSLVDETVRLSVTDDGIGFDPTKPVDGFGLRGMRARAEQVGGTVRVHSGQSGGTTVELEVSV